MLAPRRTARPAVRQAAVAPLLAAACIAVVVAGCGGSGASKRTQRASAHAGQFLAFSECMRSHGVTNFPDPSSAGGRIEIGSGSGINPSSPSFQAAQKTCQHLLPGGGPLNGKPTAQEIQAMVQVSECMRAHGVTGFPDPTEGTVPDNPSAYSAIEDRGGVILAIPKSIDPTTPAFQHASAVCQFGPGGRHPGAKVTRAAG